MFYFFQADLFKIIDEPLPTNGGNELNTHNNLFDLLNNNQQQQSISSSNPLEDILFGNNLPKSQSINGKLYLFCFFFNEKFYYF